MTFKMWFYFIVFLFIVLAGSIYNFKLTRKSYWLYYFLWFSLFLIAGFRSPGVDNDYYNYLDAITGYGGMLEPSFYFISFFCYHVLGSAQLVFIVYAFLSLTILFIAFKKLASYFFLTVTIYFCTFYVLHELNQIRAGVATGLALLSLLSLLKNRRGIAVFYILSAVFFHFSYIILLPLIFVLKDTRRNLIYFLLFIPCAYLMYFFHIDILFFLTHIPIPYVQQMAVQYSEWNIDLVKSVNVFSLLIFIKLLFICLMTLYSKSLANRYKGFYLYFKMYILGLGLLIFFATLPGAAFRIAEILWIVECLVIPMIFTLFKPRWLSFFLLILLCTYWIYLNYIVSAFVRPYQMSFNV